MLNFRDRTRTGVVNAVWCHRDDTRILRLFVPHSWDSWLGGALVTVRGAFYRPLARSGLTPSDFGRAEGHLGNTSPHFLGGQVPPKVLGGDQFGPVLGSFGSVLGFFRAFSGVLEPPDGSPGGRSDSPALLLYISTGQESWGVFGVWL